jgi:hypothetical protein
LAYPWALYDEVYCAPGEMENRIKEQQPRLFADRSSSHYLWANQLRLVFSSCAYVLLETILRIGLASNELARAQAATIRLKLLKPGAVILCNARRVQLLYSSAYPHQQTFVEALSRLSSA